MELIDKATVVAEIERRQKEEVSYYENGSFASWADENHYLTLETIKSFIDTLEVKEVDEQKERIDECPYRQVGCTMYKDKILECTGACGWVVDHPKLKELKSQKGE